MQGLTENTRNNIEIISKLSCIKDYTLIGGTALSIQIDKRLSEDLDFCKWSTNLKTDKPTVDWYSIENELKTVCEVQKKDILGFDQANFVVNNVKLTFFAKQNNLSPVSKEIPLLNNIKVANIESIGAMKIEVCLRRNKFRDYYDIYSILKEGFSLKELISKASMYSNRTLKSRDALHFLSRGEIFMKEKEFNLLNPYYNVTSNDIEVFIKQKITDEYKK